MKVERRILDSCGACKSGTKQLLFLLDQPITSAILQVLTTNNFKEAKHFTAVGMLYVESSDLIVSGPIGGNKLTIKSKNEKTYDQKLNDLEGLLTK